MATDLLPAVEELNELEGLGDINKYDFITKTTDVFKVRKGLDADIVGQISEMKQEPAWMRDFRLRSFKIFESKPMPKWGGAIDINFRGYLLLSQADRQPREDLGRCAPGDQGNLRPAGHSRSENESFWLA